MSIMGAFAACLFTVAVPSVYHAISINGTRQALTIEAASLAKSIEKIVQARPDLWEFESVRLKEVISQSALQGGEDEREIRNAAGRLVVKTDFTELRPIISVSARFFDSGRFAGSIVVRHSIRALINTTVLLVFISVLLGCLLYFIFRTYPIGKLEKTLTDLQREKDKSEKTLYAIGDGVITVDHRGEIRFINRVAESLVGMDASEAVGRQLGEVYVLRPGQEKLAGEKWIILTGKEGKEYSIEEVRTTLTETESEEHGVVIVFRDVTEWREAENRRLLAMEIMGIINEYLPLADTISRILTAIKSETGFAAVGIRLRNNEDFPYFAQNGFSLDFLLTENSLTVRNQDGGLYRETSGDDGLECICGLVISGRTDPASPLFTPGGSFWTNDSVLLLDLPSDQDPRINPRNRCIHEGFFSIALIPVRANQEIVGLLQLNDRKKDAFTLGMIHFFEGLASLLGITLSRKWAEEEKISLAARLHRAEKLEALGQLAGGVAHDLNNVLGVLSGYSELLMEGLPEENLLRKYAENILTSSEKGAAIVQDLLTLARRGVVTSDVVNVNQLIFNFLKSPVFETIQTHHARITFRTELDSGLLNVKGSPIHLEKTLMNLISNAAEAIAESGAVTIRTENRYLDKAIHQGDDELGEGDYVILTVSDNGQGISAADLNKIFEPFYTRKVMGRSGTGLGLAVVWGTVKDHNGHIDVQSEDGKGSAFTLYFPATRDKAAENAQKIPLEQYMGQGESVLVVDDVKEQRDVATTILTRLDYRVNAVSSGEEAVEYLKSNRADIMLLDMIMLPGIDGLETYERIIASNPHQKAIMASGFSETDRIRKAQEMGVGAYVRKPYLMETVGVAIRAELGKKQSGPAITRSA